MLSEKKEAGRPIHLNQKPSFKKVDGLVLPVNFVHFVPLPQTMQGKHWCITLNNPESECLNYDESIMDFLICGTEKGEKGTKHLQGYVQFKKKKKITAVKKIWPRAHLEIAKGKPDQNVAYCSKECHVHDHGTLQAGQGTRNDLNELKLLIDAGSTWNTIRESNYSASIRYQRALKQDLRDRRIHRSWETTLHIHWGDTGTGKSRFCHESFPEAYWKTRGEWWDGYEGQSIVIIDEFYGWLPIGDLLRLSDRYPMQVPIKGGFEKFVAKEIHITSNKHYSEWWPNVTNPRVLAAFERRVGDRCREYIKLVNQ